MSTKEEGAAILEQLRAVNAAADPGQSITVPESNAAAGKFPARYLEPDAEDDRVYLKNQLASIKRPAALTDGDVDLILRKQAATEVAKKDTWFASTWRAASDNPVMQRWAQTINPEFYERRERVIDEQAALQARIAKMKLRGVGDRADFDLLYAIHQGYVNPEPVPLWKLSGTAMDRPRRGLFNPFRSKQYEKGDVNFPKDFLSMAGFPSSRGDKSGADALFGYGTALAPPNLKQTMSFPE